MRSSTSAIACSSGRHLVEAGDKFEILGDGQVPYKLNRCVM